MPGKKIFSFIFGVTLITTGISIAYAEYISPISDLIASSQPSTSTPHIITFQSESGVPASGSIVITPESAFSIPVGFDYQDVDLAVASGGPYAERNLAATASGVNDGVSVVTGSSGSITITLNSSDSIPADAMVRVVLGTSATHQVAGNTSPVNPATPGSYRIQVETMNGGSVIDNAKTMIAIVEPVTISLDIIEIPPEISNGLPSGTIAAGSNVIELSLQTDKLATCRYATSTGVVYDSMTGTFSTIGSLVFYTVVSGHSNGSTYHYYVRCSDVYGVKNTTDYDISFTLDATPSIEVSDGTTPGAGTGGGGGAAGSGGIGQIPNGSSVLFQSRATITGLAPANSTVHILKDGKEQATTQALADGSFTTTLTSLERGTYTFVTYATDARARRTSNFSSTITLAAGTVNSINNVVLSPTLSTASETVGVGEDIAISGTGIPGTDLEIVVSSAAEGAVAKTYRASTTPQNPAGTGGAWEFTIPSRDLSRGTYEIRAKTIAATQSSNLSSATFVGVGEAPTRTNSTGSRSDINADGKVNLVDFSIMLTNWGTGDTDSDINEDGTINLADFSILLFNWTG